LNREEMFRGYLKEGPKHALNEFYGYREELSEVIGNLTSRRTVTAVLGPRRIGKTSLVLTAYAAAVTQGAAPPESTVLIHADFRGVNSRVAALHAVLNGYRASERIPTGNNAVRRYRDALLERILYEEHVTENAGISAVIVKGGVSKTRVRKAVSEGLLEGFRDVFELIEDVCSEKKLTCIVFLDELHEIMGRLRGAKDEVPQTLAYAHDTLTHIRVVVSGSRIRLTESIIQHEELIQRTSQIRMKPLTPRESHELLRKAFTDHGVEYTDRVLEEGHRISGGVAGWLTEYGRRYVLSYHAYGEPLKALSNAVEATLTMMKTACLEELVELRRRLRGAATYTTALKILDYVAKGIGKPTDLKRITGLSTGTFNHIIKLLMKYDILTRNQKDKGVEYVIGDPAIAVYFRAETS